MPRTDEITGKRALGYLNWLRRRRVIHRSDVLDSIVRDLAAQKHDHLAITGDLVNIALAAEFRPARAWLEQLGAPDHVTLVPGNHDLYVRETAAQAQREWGAYMRGDEFESFPFVRRRGNVALVGLSSALPTAPFLATGQLGEKQLAQLEELLATLGGEGLFRVVLIHHPPVSEPARYLKRLTDSASLRTVLQHGAELLIHGPTTRAAACGSMAQVRSCRRWAYRRPRHRRPDRTSLRAIHSLRSMVRGRVALRGDRTGFSSDGRSLNCRGVLTV